MTSKKPQPASATRKRRRRARGYLLIEVMASGAILAVMLGAAVTQVSAYRMQTATASRRAQAALYAQQTIAWVTAQPTTTAPACPPAAFDPPAPFVLTCAVAAITPVSTPVLQEPMYDVTVAVSYPSVADPTVSSTSTHQARIRTRNVIYTPIN